MKSEKKKILSGKECEVMNYLPYFKEPPIDVRQRLRLPDDYRNRKNAVFRDRDIAFRTKAINRRAQ